MRPWWLWPNLLGLDAPLIALVWQELFGRCFRIPLNWPVRAGLALAVWVVYLVDRRLDVRPGTAAEHSADRHRFVAENRRAFSVMIAVSGTAGLFLVPSVLRPRLVAAGMAFAILIALYLAVVHLPRRAILWPGLKEVLVGIFFSGGVGLFLIPVSASDWPAIGVSLAVFGTVCAVNCAAIARWEAADSLPGMRRGLLTKRGFRRTGLGAAVLALVLSFLPRWQTLRPLFCAAALSLLVLVWLDHRSRQIRPTSLRVLADVALLTPILWFLVQ